MPPRFPRLVLLALVCAALSLTAMPAAPKRVLFFTKCSNFEHTVVKRRNGQPSWAEQILAREAPAQNIVFTFSKDGSLFTTEYLAQFDAFMFYTSGDLLSPGKDGNPPMTPAGKAALLAAIAGGKGFVGVHSAADTFHTGETAATNTAQARTWRYQRDGRDTDPYLRMLGGELIVHGTQQIARLDVINPTFPGFTKLGPTIERMGEWYSLTDFAPDLHVLLRLDPAHMRDPNANGKDWPPVGWDTPYQRPPFPSTWARLEGRGRVFYTSMGHREDEWLDPQFLGVLFGGLAWAVRAVDAPIEPNLAQVTPHAAHMPPASKPVAGMPKDKAAELEKLSLP